PLLSAQRVLYHLYYACVVDSLPLASFFLLFSPHPATTPFYTLSLHDALPISAVHFKIEHIAYMRARTVFKDKQLRFLVLIKHNRRSLRSIRRISFQRIGGHIT